ncbi:helicase associated domain-containing protein [Streptomyces sp. NPDC093093]|uniref:helicase associated domain-containing protein n=1 Tax=Streptomyces sp. NPDC093093 TaxID=3366025 RepID=UPI003803CA78
MTWNDKPTSRTRPSGRIGTISSDAWSRAWRTRPRTPSSAPLLAPPRRLRPARWPAGRPAGQAPGRDRWESAQPPDPPDDADTRSLADWLTKQRAARRNGQLTDKQIAALDELGMDWDPLGSRWQQALQAARGYHREHGHLRPGTTSTAHSGRGPRTAPPTFSDAPDRAGSAARCRRPGEGRRR